MKIYYSLLVVLILNVINISAYKVYSSEYELIVKFKDSVIQRDNDGSSNIPEPIKEINKKFGVVSCTPVFSSIMPFHEIKASHMQRTLRVPPFIRKSTSNDFTSLKNIYKVTFSDIAHLEDLIRAYRSFPGIEYVERNVHLIICDTPIDDDDETQWALDAMNIPEAWKISTGSPSTLIAVLSTGIDTMHPELNGKIWAKDNIHGYNFVMDNTDITDTHGSGTALAGIIAANATNQTGISGIDWYASIMPVVTQDNDGVGSCISLCQGIYYAVNNGADIILIGGKIEGESNLLNELINYAYHCGCVVIAPSESEPLSLSESKTDDQKVITVTPCGKQSVQDASIPDNGINLYAPGLNCISLRPKKQDETDYSHCYETRSGANIAAAHIAGIVSLMLSVNAGFYNEEIEPLIKSSLTEHGIPDAPAILRKSAIPRESIMADLFSPTLEKHQKSVHNINERGNGLVYTLLEKLVYDPSITVGEKGILINALGTAKSYEAVPYLIELLRTEDNSYIRRAIAQALGAIGDKRAGEALVTILSDSDAGVRYKAVTAIAEIQYRDAGNTIIDLLNDQDERVVFATIDALAVLKVEQSLPSLIKRLEGREVSQIMKDAIVVSLGELGNEDTLTLLYEYREQLAKNKPQEDIVIFEWKNSLQKIDHATEKITRRITEQKE